MSKRSAESQTNTKSSTKKEDRDLEEDLLAELIFGKNIIGDGVSKEFTDIRSGIQHNRDSIAIDQSAAWSDDDDVNIPKVAVN